MSKAAQKIKELTTATEGAITAFEAGKTTKPFTKTQDVIDLLNRYLTKLKE